MFGATLAVPLVVADAACIRHDPLVVAQLISTVFFASGISTALQITFGVRYVRYCALLY